MIANYGYTDGSGSYYITIDTDRCATCAEHSCTQACPVGMFVVEPDDYDDDVASIGTTFRHNIKYACAPCKPVANRPPLPCAAACKAGAISHSW
ncbi:MAG: ferredoxin [Calditrichaeota bacterium]|nr:ferredoxin [Calditrichota bacterium]